MKQAVMLGVAVFLAGCATTNPILATNAHLQRVGQEQARRDIHECQTLADQLVPLSPAERAAHEAALAGRRGEAIGVGPSGAGGAAVVTTVPPGSAPSGPGRPTAASPAWKDFVSSCMKDRGYEVVGWE